MTKAIFGVFMLVALTSGVVADNYTSDVLTNDQRADAQRIYLKESKLEQQIDQQMNTHDSPEGGDWFTAYIESQIPAYASKRLELALSKNRLLEASDKAKRNVAEDSRLYQDYSPGDLKLYFYGKEGVGSYAEMEKEINALVFLANDESDTEFRDGEYEAEQLLEVLGNHIRYCDYLVDIDIKNTDRLTATIRNTSIPFTVPKKVRPLPYAEWKKTTVGETNAEYFMEHPEAKAEQARKDKALMEQLASPSK